MTLSLRAYCHGKKGLLIACYLLTMIASVIVSWILYTGGHVLLIFPLLCTVMSMASLVVLISLYVLFGCNRGCPPSAFKAQEARIQRICFPFLRVTKEDLVAATANFSHRKIIGRGRFGMVYRGILSNGQVVAIKRIKSSPFAKDHFLSELHILGQLRHRNLLRILGYFHSTREMMLLSKFMPNLNLDILLHGPQDCRLNWRERVNIALGVASALEYLHHGCSNSIVHCDVKPTNILLDEHLEPHLADFGLALIISNSGVAHSSSRTTFAFTVGYTAPERAYLTTMPSPKVDVYSYGILLLELCTGLRPTSATLTEMGVTISQWARSALAENNCMELIDGCLKGDSEFHGEIQRVIGLGIQCTEESAGMRPAMNDVVKRLEEIMGIKKQWNIPLEVLAYQETQIEEHCLLPGESSSQIC